MQPTQQMVWLKGSQHNKWLILQREQLQEKCFTFK
jgi:hypothetical protein